MSIRRQARSVRFGWLGGCAWLLLAPGQTGAQLTVTETVTPTFGIVMGGPAGRQLILNTNDTVTGADAADYMFGAVSGQVVLMKRGGPEWVHVVAENVSASGGLIANSILCQWHNGPQTSCEGTGLTELVRGRRILRLGVDVTTSQFHFGGDTASVSFDITATFL